MVSVQDVLAEASVLALADLAEAGVGAVRFCCAWCGVARQVAGLLAAVAAPSLCFARCLALASPAKHSTVSFLDLPAGAADSSCETAGGALRPGRWM